jgi:hypothetical protein
MWVIEVIDIAISIMASSRTVVCGKGEEKRLRGSKT